jgi:hypothetical protein
MAIKHKSKEKRNKKRFFIFTLIIVIVALLALSLNMILENAVRNKLAGYIRQDQNRIYDIKLENVKINIWKGNFLVSHVKITPRTDSLFLKPLRSYAHIQLDTFQIKGLDVKGLLVKNRLSMETVELISPGTKYYLDTAIAPGKKKSPVPLKEILSKQFQSASIEKFNFSNASIAYFNVNDTIPVFIADSISLHISSLLIDTTSINKRIPFGYDEMDFSLRHLELTSMKFYTIGIGSFKIFSDDRSLIINNFIFKPKYTREEYSKLIPYETDWFDILAEHIKLQGFNPVLFEEQGTFSVDSLTIEKLRITIFRDKHVDDPPYKYKKLFGSMIMDIPVKINIPDIAITDGRLTYQEIAEKGTLPGEIVLADLSVRGSNLTNDSALLVLDSNLSLRLNAKLNGEAELNVVMDVIIPDTTDKFLVTGTLGAMPLSKLNTFTENNLSVKIESGKLKNMAFKFTSNDDRSVGTMDFEYTDLKGVLLNQEKEMSRKLISAAANVFIKNDNIKGSKGYKQGKINVERRKDKGIVNYLLKSIISGLSTSAVPILEKKQEKKQEKKNNHR